MSRKFVWAATLAFSLVCGFAGSAGAQDLGYYDDQGSDPGFGGASVYQPFRYPKVVHRDTHGSEAYGYDRAGPSETYQTDPYYADPYNGGRPYREGGAADYDLAEASREMTRAIVANTTNEPPGTIVIDTEARELFYTQPNGQAYRYGIGVGREGFAWHGVAKVQRKAEWPDWVPPSDMLKRRPDLPLRMSGGLDNPLGARAMYLFKGNKDTMFRIHGTNEPETIGHAVSSGCIRMMNADVIDLYKRVPVGTKVVVL